MWRRSTPTPRASRPIRRTSGTACTSSGTKGRWYGFLTNAGATTTGDGHYAIAYFDQTDLPFYYFLANTYAISDRMFSSVLSGTFANRNYLLLGSSYGIKNTLVDGYPTGKRTIFDALDEKGVTWGVYTPTEPLEGTLG